MASSASRPSDDEWIGPLVERLNEIRAGLAEVHRALRLKTHIKIGGRADVFVLPKTVVELERVLRLAKEWGVPVRVIGDGANVLVADSGVRGVVIKLAKGFRRVDQVNATTLRLDAGANNKVCAAEALRLKLSGLEFLDGIPGTPGGGVRMNAGAYGGSFSQVVSRVFAVSHSGSGWLDAREVGFSHRSSEIPDDVVVAQVEVKLTPSDRVTIKQSMNENEVQRHDDQPHNKKTFGSTFLNPRDIGDGPYAAGQVIESCGLKGHTAGGALISVKHANWIENVDGATADEVVELMQTARAAVFESYGVVLRPEVVLMGDIALVDPPVAERETSTSQRASGGRPPG